MIDFDQIRQQTPDFLQSSAQRTRLRESVALEVAERLATPFLVWDEVQSAWESMGGDASVAFPLVPDTPLVQTFPPIVCPSQATIVAVDGSQIVPDHHAPFVYGVLNVGGIVYPHGQDLPPSPFTRTQLLYPQGDDLDNTPYWDTAGINLARDLLEIGTLADKAVEALNGGYPYVFAWLDQRLLYTWLGVSHTQGKEAVDQWQNHIGRLTSNRIPICGYIDRPLKNLVVRLAEAIQGNRMATWHGVTDSDVFAILLPPYHRSITFLDVSPANQAVAQHWEQQEVCFFYFNPSSAYGRVARVDIPRWVAEDEQIVDDLHALLVEQCKMLGNYPYALARADEMAVVKHGERDQIEQLLGSKLVVSGSYEGSSRKANAKGWVRSEKQRF
jgi:hypothetical protein